MSLTISSDYLRAENELVAFVARELMDIFIYYTVTQNTVNSSSVYIQDKEPHKSQYIFLEKEISFPFHKSRKSPKTM